MDWILLNGVNQVQLVSMGGAGWAELDVLAGAGKLIGRGKSDGAGLIGRG